MVNKFIVVRTKVRLIDQGQLSEERCCGPVALYSGYCTKDVHSNPTHNTCTSQVKPLTTTTIKLATSHARLARVLQPSLAQ